jgi:itaconyl-CoA hydratase
MIDGRIPCHLGAGLGLLRGWNLRSRQAASTIRDMTVDDVSAIANLGWKNIDLKTAVFPRDKIYAHSEVIDVRESRLRPSQDIVSTRTEGFKSGGVVFKTFGRQSLTPNRVRHP